MARRPTLSVSQIRALECLLGSHYLADDFPSIVTTMPFARFVAATHADLHSREGSQRRTTQYVTFSAPRTTTTRRVLAFPHPESQLALCQILAENQTAVAETIRRSELSLYDTSEDQENGRMFVGLNFEQRSDREAQVLARHPIVLVADIANFFHTIYSHSLPWAVLGKQHVKEIMTKAKQNSLRREFEAHWSNRLDGAIQQANWRETFGIPVGPDTSRIIAEVLLSGLHSDVALAGHLTNREGYRLLDDFYIGFDDEVTARGCLDALRRSLWEYNLHLNDGKTRIERSSMFFEGGWKYEIENFLVPDGDDLQQRAAIQRLMELTLQHCHVRNDGQPASFFCARLNRLPIAEANFDFVKDCLLRVARDFTNCLKSVVRFATQYRHRFLESGKPGIMRQWCDQMLATHAPRRHDLEVSSVLAICGILGLSVNRDDVVDETRTPSPVVLAALGLLSEDGLLDVPWDECRPQPENVGNPAEGRYWLPYYEAVRRDWTNDPTLIETFARDEFFKRLLTKSVTFLDNSDFLSCAKSETRDRPDDPDDGSVVRGPVRSERSGFFEGYE